MTPEAQEARQKISALFRAAERQEDYPMEYFLARERAQKALEAWRVEYPEAAEIEKQQHEEWAAERQAQREENYKNSFIARGLD